MQDLTPEAERSLEEIANRHGVSRDAALTLLRALAAGGGTMAQFSHPELGGMGQWSKGGMVMVGDMFNQGLKYRVDTLCNDLSALLREAALFTGSQSPQFQSQQPGGLDQGFSPGTWWPAELGSPASSGAQNDMRYAYFPASHRLAVQQGGQLRMYNTGSYQIFGVSQQQGASRTLTFSSDQGMVQLADLRPVEGPPEAASQPARPAPGWYDPPAVAAAAPPTQPDTAAPAPPGDDPLALIERLAELHRRGILTEEEFAAKKAELLSRL